jgi:hypothetical protein
MSSKADEMTGKPDETSGAVPPKKPYESPRLDVYGDIREIARAAGMMGMADGGAHQMNKTR